MRVVRSCLGIAALLLSIASACFNEPASPSDGCTRGTAGCPCELGSCDPGLECVAALELCIPEDCDPGTELCTCYEGECFGTLVCDGQLCRPPQPGTSGDATTAVAEVTGASTTTSNDQSSGTTITASSESGDATSTSGLSTTDTGSDAGPCHACVTDSNMMGGGCVAALEPCTPNSECVALAECVLAALDADDTGAVPGCCEMHPAGTPQYAALSACWQTACTECDPFALGCGG